MKLRFTPLFLISWALGVAVPFNAAAQNGQVRIVYFSEPRCGYCERLKTLEIPEWQMRYGEQLRILEVDISTSRGWDLFQSTIEFHALPRAGVPMMILDNHVLLGLTEILNRLDGMIAHYLTLDGTEWPPIPGLEELLAELDEGVGTNIDSSNWANIKASFTE